MTRKTTKHFLIAFGCYNELNVERYKSGWSLSEIKMGKEVIQETYEQEVKGFKKTIVTKKK